MWVTAALRTHLLLNFLEVGQVILLLLLLVLFFVVLCVEVDGGALFLNIIEEMGMRVGLREVPLLLRVDIRVQLESLKL